MKTLTIPPLTVGEVQFVPIKPKDGLIGFASLVINRQIYVGSVAVYSRADGLGIRLLFPSKTLPNGLTVSCVHPICREAGQTITDAVAKKMEEIFLKRREP